MSLPSLGSFESDYVARLRDAAVQLVATTTDDRRCYVLIPPGASVHASLIPALESIFSVLEFPALAVNLGKANAPLFLDHRAFRYTDNELNVLLKALNSTHKLGFMDVYQLRQLTGGLPGVTEAALRDIAAMAPFDDTRPQFSTTVSLAQLPETRRFMALYWLPAIMKYCPCLAEISLLPLLTNDLLSAAFKDHMGALHSALLCGWLECRPNKLGQLRIDTMLEQSLLLAVDIDRDIQPIEAALDWYVKQGLAAEAVECAAILNMTPDEIFEVTRLAASYAVRVHPLAALVNKRADGAIAIAHARPLPLSVMLAERQRDKSAGKLIAPDAIEDETVEDAGDPFGVAMGYVLSALSHHQRDRPSATAVALSLAARAGIDKQQLKRLISLVEPLSQQHNVKNPHRLSRVLFGFQHARPARASVSQQGPLLNHRETQIINLISEGLTNKEIGARLSLELSTVKWYATRIYEKLSVSNRTQAIARARVLRIVE
mgnify:CR=1 FL=1